MVTYKKFSEELINRGIDKSIVDKLIEEYRIVKKEHFLGDDEKAILHSAKVSDLVLAVVKQKISGTLVDVNNIYFGTLFDELVNLPKSTPEDVILTLAIPRVAQSICTIRSKKNVAHVKTIDPSVIDGYYCVSACDWMVSELVLLLYKSDPNEASELINSILRKKIPSVEEFEDGTIVILRNDLTVKQQILLVLYNFYPKRMSGKELKSSIKTKNVYQFLQSLESENLIHKTKQGSKLTKLGILFVEEKILAQ